MQTHTQIAKLIIGCGLNHGRTHLEIFKDLKKIQEEFGSIEAFAKPKSIQLLIYNTRKVGRKKIPITWYITISSKPYKWLRLSSVPGAMLPFRLSSKPPMLMCLGAALAPGRRAIIRGDLLSLATITDGFVETCFKKATWGTCFDCGSGIYGQPQTCSFCGQDVCDQHVYKKGKKIACQYHRGRL